MDVLDQTTRRAVIDKYLHVIEDDDDVSPDAMPLPYGLLPDADQLAWRISIADELVTGDLQELTNTLNGWRGALRQWEAWNKAVVDLDEDTRWGAELEFVAPVAFMCMFMPSSTRDRFGFVATAAMHQVQMALDPTRSDLLDGDAPAPGKPNRHLSRRAQETQLEGLVQQWAEGQSFMQLLRSIDGSDYAAATMNFRNRASHGLAPRFTVGYVQTVTRHWGQPTELVQIGEGPYHMERPIPNKMAASYGFGGTPPLGMSNAHLANLAQFRLAKECFDSYVALLRTSMAGMRKREHPAT